jgi:hypothetical protein
MENKEGREGKTPFCLKILEKNKEKKERVSDTKGFRQQNPLDLKCFERNNLGIE